MEKSSGFWVGIIVVLLLLILGFWWFSVNQYAGFPDLGGAWRSNNESATTPATQGVQVTNRSSSSVVSIAGNLEGASTFAAWLNSSGVAAQITGKGPYTIFVPTNGSIGQLPAGTFTNLSAAEQKRFVQYHVVSGRAIDVDAQIAGSISALSKDPLNFSYGTDKIPMVNSSIIIAAYKGSNGIVYLIDNPLIPPKK